MLKLKRKPDQSPEPEHETTATAAETLDAQNDITRKVGLLKQTGDTGLATMNNQIELMTGKKYNVREYWSAVDYNWQEHIASGINVGLFLIGLKNNLPHGEFMDGLQERDIPERTARNYMAVARQFHALDAGFRNELGMAKLYKLLKAPEGDQAQLAESGDTSFATKEELLTISAAELEARIKDAKQSASGDANNLKDKNFKLTQELNATRRELEAVKSGAGAIKTPPAWWNSYLKLLGTFETLEKTIAIDTPPDLSNPEEKQLCELAATQLDNAMSKIRKYMLNLAYDPDKIEAEIAKKTSEIKSKHSKWNLDAVENNI